MTIGADIARVWTIVAVLLTASPCLAQTIPVPASGGYEVPAYKKNTEIRDVYQAPDGHIVLSFTAYDKNEFQFDYYDTKLGKRLFPQRSVEMAHSPGGALGDKLRPKDLKRIEDEIFELKGLNGEFVSKQCDCGAKYTVPYSERIAVSSNGRNASRFALFVKSAHRAKWSDGVGDRQNAMVQYDNDDYIRFLAPDKDGFWIVTGRLLFRFTWSGQAKVLANRVDVIAVPHDRLRPIIIPDYPQTWPPTKRRYADADALISTVARQQKAGKVANLRITDHERE